MNRKKAKYFVILLALGILIIYPACKYALKAKDEFFYPIIVNTIPPVNNYLEKILHDFETILKDKNTTAYNSLNQGLSTDDINQLEVKYNVKIPEEIRSLYMWHNGCSNFKDGLTCGAIIPGHWFVPLEQALELSRKSGQPNTTFVQNIFHECFAGHRKDWIVLLDDGCGDGYFYDPKRLSGSGYVFYHFAEISHYVFFPSLKNALQAFIECYQKDVFKFGNEIMDIEDFEAEEKIMSKYGVSVN